MYRRLACAAVIAAIATPAAALKDDETTAEYAITIAGLEIGETRVKLTAAGDSYDLSFEGGFRFLFWSGEAAGQVVGARAAGGFDPERYQIYFDGPTREMTSTIGFEGGRPTEWGVTPPPEDDWLEGRIPIADTDLSGAIDPVTAFLILADAPDEACSRSMKVFSGFVRFDLTLSPGGAPMNGVIDCKVGYSPVSGHRAESEGVARLQREGMTVSLYEMADGVWAPHRLGFPTSVGTLSIERRL